MQQGPASSLASDKPLQSLHNFAIGQIIDILVK